VRLITYYTPSHADMAEKYVLPMGKYFEGMTAFTERQICPSAEWKSEKWSEATSDKLRRISELEPDGGLDFFCDADVVFKQELSEWLQITAEAFPESFILYGRDAFDNWCTGVMLFRRTKEVIRWFTAMSVVCQLLNENDQDGIHAVRMSAKKMPFHMGFLNNQVICNLATLGYTSPWKGEPFEVPKSCLLWHANYTLGTGQKGHMLSIVQDALKSL